MIVGIESRMSAACLYKNTSHAEEGGTPSLHAARDFTPTCGYLSTPLSGPLSRGRGSRELRRICLLPSLFLSRPALCLGLIRRRHVYTVPAV